MCSIVLEKAFDRIQYDKMLQILEITEVDGKDIRLLTGLNWHLSPIVRVRNEVSDEIEIKKDVRVGSFIFFNLYSKKFQRSF